MDPARNPPRAEAVRPFQREGEVKRHDRCVGGILNVSLAQHLKNSTTSSAGPIWEIGFPSLIG